VVVVVDIVVVVPLVVVTDVVVVVVDTVVVVPLVVVTDVVVMVIVDVRLVRLEDKEVVVVDPGSPVLAPSVVTNAKPASSVVVASDAVDVVSGALVLLAVELTLVVVSFRFLRVLDSTSSRDGATD